MNLIPLFDRLETLERETGRLYRIIAENVSLQFPELVPLFSRLADEEAEHEKTVSMAHTLLCEAEKITNEIITLETGLRDPGFDVLEDKVSQLDLQLSFVREKQALFLAGPTKLKVSQIVSMALDIELQMQESHHMRVFQLRDPKFIRLMESLFQADQAHASLLRDWLKKPTSSE